MLHNI
jgi:hypothetical protein